MNSSSRSDFQILSAGTITDPPGATFGPRVQTNYEFIWIRAGSVSARLGSKSVKGPPGTLLLVRPGTKDSYDWSKSQRTIHSFLHFLWKRTSAGGLSPSRWPAARLFSQDHLIFRLFRRVLAFSSLDSSTEKGGYLLLEPILDLMLRLYLWDSDEEIEETAPSGLSPTVEKALRWMKDKAPTLALRKIRLMDMARHVSLSPQHLCRLFKKDLRIGPAECVKLMKIEFAGSLLERSHLTIKEISNRCGFENPFHFSRVFKSVYGLSPLFYREGFKKNRLFRPGSTVFRKYQSQRILINRAINTVPDSFRLQPKRYQLKVR